jgi:hypothetical protein
MPLNNIRLLHNGLSFNPYKYDVTQIIAIKAIKNV